MTIAKSSINQNNTIQSINITLTHNQQLIPYSQQLLGLVLQLAKLGRKQIQPLQMATYFLDRIITKLSSTSISPVQVAEWSLVPRRIRGMNPLPILWWPTFWKRSLLMSMTQKFY